MIEIRFIGQQVLLLVARLTIQMIQTVEMFIIGKYGMEDVHFRNIENFSSVMLLSLDFRHCQVKKR